MKANETKLAEAMQKCLSPAEYIEFLDALEEVLDSGVRYDDGDSVMYAFTWFDTPQGEDFWIRYYNIQEGNLRD